jgi:hypothetical protein
MNLLLLLALAVPLSCLAFLSLLALLGVMTLGGVIHLLGTVRARRPLWPNVEPANNPAGRYRRRGRAVVSAPRGRATLAVCRLMTNSRLVDCETGRSAAGRG